MGPLTGVKVLDLSRLAPGPYCSMLLGDLGAEVLRIDAPTPPARTYRLLARNKRSLILDLKNRHGQEVLHRLCASSDVLLEGNRPGVMMRLGADYETVAAINPRIVYCSLTGYGQDGPLAAAAGHDINYIAIAGVLSQMGDGRRPLPPLNLVADFGGGGLLAAFGIVCALFERATSGRGQFIDAAMLDGAASIMAAHYSTGGTLSRPGVGLLGGGAPFYRCYRCRDGGFVAVGAVEPKFWTELCAVTGLVELASQQMERDRWPEMSARLERRFLEKARDEWTEAFKHHDACVSPVLELDEAPRDPHNRLRGTFFEGPDGGLHTAPAPRFSRTPGEVRSAAPEPGRHTLEVLEEAGYSTDEIATLDACGAFGPSATAALTGEER